MAIRRECDSFLHKVQSDGVHVPVITPGLRAHFKSTHTRTNPHVPHRFVADTRTATHTHVHTRTSFHIAITPEKEKKSGSKNCQINKDGFENGGLVTFTLISYSRFHNTGAGGI